VQAATVLSLPAEVVVLPCLYLRLAMVGAERGLGLPLSRI
tara:strand:+ start:944 stop:1063 length:120 start_codon:yes stop_codon:yes gene_type:complete